MHLLQATYFNLFLKFLLPQSVGAFGLGKYKERFTGWRDGYFVDIVCAKQIGAYWAENGTFLWRHQRALDCIINNTSGSALQEMSSSLVLLGLTPTMLSQLGPSPPFLLLNRLVTQ